MDLEGLGNTAWKDSPVRAAFVGSGLAALGRVQAGTGLPIWGNVIMGFTKGGEPELNGTQVCSSEARITRRGISETTHSCPCLHNALEAEAHGKWSLPLSVLETCS